MASFKGWPPIVTRANIPGRRMPSALLKRALTVIVSVLSETSRSNWYDVEISSYFLPLLKVRDAVGGVLQEGIDIVVTRLIAVYRGLLIRQGLFHYGTGCCQLLIAIQVDEGVIERRPGLIDIRFS